MMRLSEAGELFVGDACHISIYSEERDKVDSLASIDTVNGERKAFSSIDKTPSEPGKMFARVLQEGPQLFLGEDSSRADDDWLESWGDTSRKSASSMFVPIREKGNGTAVLTAVYQKLMPSVTVE